MQTSLSDIPLKCWKFQTIFFKNVPKLFQNSKTKNAKAKKYSLIYVLYYTEIISSLFFWQQLLFQFLEKFLLMFVFLLDTMGTVNQFQCSVVLIWLKIVYFQKSNQSAFCKSKKNYFQPLTFSEKWESIKQVLVSLNIAS